MNKHNDGFTLSIYSYYLLVVSECNIWQVKWWLISTFATSIKGWVPLPCEAMAHSHKLHWSIFPQHEHHSLSCSCWCYERKLLGVCVCGCHMISYCRHLHYIKDCLTCNVVRICNKGVLALMISVATVTTNIFWKNWNSARNKFVQIMRIFGKLEHLKNWGVIFWSK